MVSGWSLKAERGKRSFHVLTWVITHVKISDLPGQLDDDDDDDDDDPIFLMLNYTNICRDPLLFPKRKTERSCKNSVTMCLRR